DGRKDSQWSQALAPIEDPDEHGSSRLQVLSVIASDDEYRRQYEALFGAPPRIGAPDDIDRAFANVGKAIAAYQRQLLPGRSRFDDYVAHLEAGGDFLDQEILTRDELRGLALYIGDARCTECHNGPLLTNNEFHNTGLLSLPGELPDRGRIDGVRIVRDDPFNCLGSFSDDPGKSCGELRYMRDGPELIGATRTPSLRNLGNTAPFQSKGQFRTLHEVLAHYNDAPDAMIGHNEAKPLGLAGWQLRALEAFLLTLDAPVSADAVWLAPPSR
ncbi:MAG: cytochrome c peroxidase, partial [Woeseiaceae bacterium]|nr:cytochrome c peroxidase [Woeseiaceae bacterium]